MTMYHELESGQTVEVLHYPWEAMGNEWQDDDGDEFIHGYYYVYGEIGCLWDSEPFGPFDNYEDALAEAQNEDAELMAQ